MDHVHSKKIENLYQAILLLKTKEDSRKFFQDLLTPAELEEFANRWQVAQMLQKKVSYEEIAKETGMSSTTIARISKWLSKGMGGYRLMLERIKKK